MSTTMRTWLVVLTIASLVVVGAAYAPIRTTAANLTGGQYTYIVNGEEVAFTFDPVVRKDGVLLPTEIFQHFGVGIAGAISRNVTLTKDDVTVKVTVGSPIIDVNGQTDSVSTSPLRLNGRTFLPSDLLKQFGVEFTQDGTMIGLRTYVGSMLKGKELDSAAWSQLLDGRRFNAYIKMDSTLNNYGELTLLHADLINTVNFGASYGVRARLLGLLETNTLVMVKISNYAHKAGAMTVANSIWLVDNLRNQYDLVNVMDIGGGLVSNKLSPGADRMSVLVFTKADPLAEYLQVYYDPSGSSLGQFWKTR